MDNDIARLWQTAEAHLAQRNGEAARSTYQAIVAREPRHAPAWLRLSNLASLRGEYREAVTAALAAGATRPLDTSLRIHVCERLVQVGESKAAHDCYLEARQDDATSAEVRAEFAFLMQQLGEPALALALADGAAARGLRTPEFRSLHATLLMFSGRIDDAERELEACLLDAPYFASAHWTLSKLRTWSAERNHIDRLQRALASTSSDSPAAPYLHFALFKELEDSGRHAEAWAALVRGCAARRRSLQYDRAAEHALFEQLIARCSPAFLSGQTPACDGPQPIFIVGMPRSGTTLLERILGAHPQVREAGELHDFPFQMLWACDHQSPQVLDSVMVARAERIDYAELGRRYLAHTQWRARGRSFYTDKLPRNFMHIGFIHRALPGAKILHVVRDPMDTCFSNLKELFGAAYPHSYDMGELAAHFRDYRRLMAHWHSVLPGRILDVSYEALVDDPERVAREVLGFCGLPWEPGCIAIEQHATPTATASTAQVREPIHRRNIAQWKRYERQLEPLRRLLA